MAVALEYAGFLYTDAGVAVSGATVELLDKNTTTPVRATTTTDANGYWAITHTTAGSFDVRITSGASIRWIKFDDARQISSTFVGNSFKVGAGDEHATTAGTNLVSIFDGTAPVGTLANGVSLYSTSGELRVMDAAGNATLLSPHDAETNEWIYQSRDNNGKVLRVNMEKLVKKLEEVFGWGFVEEFLDD